MNGDIPIIKSIDVSKTQEIKKTILKNNLTNDYTNTNLGQTKTYGKNKEEDKTNIIVNDKEEIINNHEQITIRAKKYHTTQTIIEVKLPNPYLDTECVKFKRYIDYHYKNKLKTKYADYLNSKNINNSNKIEKKSIKTFKIPMSNVDKYIYFTNFSNKKN